MRHRRRRVPHHSSWPRFDALPHAADRDPLGRPSSFDADPSVVRASTGSLAVGEFPAGEYRPLQGPPRPACSKDPVQPGQPGISSKAEPCRKGPREEHCGRRRARINKRGENIQSTHAVCRTWCNTTTTAAAPSARSVIRTMDHTALPWATES